MNLSVVIKFKEIVFLLMNQSFGFREVLAEQTECYIRALQWILFYYYRGVSSWGWFYPHHYAPYASDIKNFKHLKLEFSMGKPFLPFEQVRLMLFIPEVSVYQWVQLFSC